MTKCCFWQSGEKEMAITFGEVLTDLDWEIEYQFDPASVPRDFRKQYLVEQAKHKLKKLLDRQITRHEKDSKKIDELRRKAYTGLFEEQRDNRETKGHLAEKMVRNFLKKIAIDLNLSLEVFEADVHQDVEDKIDFVLRRRSYDRGVKVEEGEVKQDLGIQFTIDMRIDTEFRKRKQLERAKRLGSELNLDDLVLVRIDLNDLVIPAIRDWEKEKPPGGPDRFLPSAIKRKIFFELLANIFTPKEIETAWQRVENK